MSLFYVRLTELCREKGMSISAVMKELGMSHSAATLWKKEETVPFDSTLDKIARYFNTNKDWVAGLTDKKTFYGQEHLVGLDEELLTALRSLTPQQVEVVRAFVSGLTTPVSGHQSNSK